MGRHLFELTMQESILCLTYLFELYHSLGHLTVLTGYRMLPRKDLVSVRYYFLLDAACAAWAFYIHQAAYFYYYSTWDKSWAAKRVISWSSLDWDRGRWNQIDLVLGTAFDMGVHIANTYLIGQMISVTSLITGTAITLVLYKMVIGGKSFAWASKASMPDWVAKRIKPLTSEQRQEIQWMDQLKVK